MEIKKKKVAIFTFWNTKDNYGQVLQCYALQVFLKQLGYDPLLIRAVPSKNIKKLLLHPLAFYKAFKDCFSYSYWQIRFTESQKKKLEALPKIIEPDRNFDLFRSKYISTSNKIYSYEDLLFDPPIADIYITGSDQVWASPIPSFLYFLKFGDKGVKRISYAASFGKLRSSKPYIRLLSSALKRFDLITVREHDGVEICRNAGFEDIHCVPDPTMLISKSEYSKLTEKLSPFKKKYVLIYLLGNNKTDLVLDDVYKYANEHNCEVKQIASHGSDNSYEKIYPTIEEWIHLIGNAECVFTNSFHGTVFSIIFNKKFIIIPLVGEYSNMNSRIDTLLADYNLEICRWNGGSFYDKMIDYTEVNESLLKRREGLLVLFKKFLSENKLV